jgi:hypothetical protein
MSDFANPEQDDISDRFTQQRFYDVDMAGSAMRTGSWLGDGADHQSDQMYTWNSAEISATPNNPQSVPYAESCER